MSAKLGGITSVMSNEEIEIIHEQKKIESESEPQGKWARFFKKLEVPHTGKPLSVLRNPDLEPISVEDRTWGFWSFFAYWGLPNFAVATFSTGSALLDLNLNIQQSIGALVIANVLIAVVTIMNSNPGIRCRIGYTLDQRMIFGIRGSFIGIIFRVGLSVVQYGYLAWLGGLCTNMIFSSFSLNYLNMENTFPSSVPMAKRDCISFLIFQIIQMPLAFVKPRKVNIPSIISCFMTLFAIIGIMAYLISKNGGPGPLFYKKVDLSTSERSWMWLYAIAIWYSGVSAGVANQSDYSRFSSNSRASYLGLFLGIVIPGTFVSLAGMLCASACLKLYGTAYWTPDEIVAQWLNDNYSSKARAAAFFIGISFTSSQVFLNMTQNGYACGFDLTGLAPKYINVTRGTLFCQLISWVVQPWTFFNTASSFLNVMSSFGIFTSPIITINVIDFYIIRKQKVSLLDFFTLSPLGTYWYWKGINLRAVAALICGVTLGLPGLAYSANTHIKVNQPMMNYYYGYFFFIPLVTGCVYYGLNLIFPHKHNRQGENDPIDYFNCFTEQERLERNMVAFDNSKGDVYQYLDAEESSMNDLNEVNEVINSDKAEK